MFCSDLWYPFPALFVCSYISFAIKKYIKDDEALRFLSFPSRHIRQQSRCHPGPVRRRLHRQRHRLQRRQRLPGYWRGVDHRSHRLARRGQALQSGPGKPGLLRHPLHHPGRGVRDHAAVPAAGVGGWRRAGRTADLQAANVAAVRLAVAGLHPAGFTGGLLPYTTVLNGEERRGEGERPTANMKRKRVREREMKGRRNLQRQTGMRRDRRYSWTDMG